MTSTLASHLLRSEPDQASDALPSSASMGESAAVTALAALAQPMRLRVFRALVGAAPAGLTPGVLAATLGLPPSSLSFHLKELSRAGLVEPRRSGRHIVYRPVIGHMNALLGYLTEHCCQGEPCGMGASAANSPSAPCTPASCTAC